MEKENWVTEKEVSQLTGIAIQTPRNNRHKCVGLPYSKIGRSVRYKIADAVSFMEQCRVVPGSREA